MVLHGTSTRLETVAQRYDQLASIDVSSRDCSAPKFVAPEQEAASIDERELLLVYLLERFCNHRDRGGTLFFHVIRRLVEIDVVSEDAFTVATNLEQHRKDFRSLLHRALPDEFFAAIPKILQEPPPIQPPFAPRLQP